jgi:hypothetical protein
MNEEFTSLPPFHKLSAIASTLMIPALILFLVSSIIVGIDFTTERQSNTLTKKTFVLGLGASTGLFMISCGAMMRGNREEAERQKKLKPDVNCPCYKCKYYSWSDALPCAVNPSIVLTKEANNCQDWALNDANVPGTICND